MRQQRVLGEHPDRHLVHTRPVRKDGRAVLGDTVVELDKLARTGVNPIFFRLGDDPGLARFLDQLARRSDGRVVAPDLGDLGSAVVGEFLSARFRGGWDADDWLE